MKLYLGSSKASASQLNADHLPIICSQPYHKKSPQIRKAFQQFSRSTHTILTSSFSALTFSKYMLSKFSKKQLKEKTFICIGTKTASTLINQIKACDIIISDKPIAESLIDLIKNLKLSPETYFLYPKSSLSRPIISHFLNQNKINAFIFNLYTTYAIKYPLNIFSNYDEIILTSSSSVYAYAKLFPIAPDKQYFCIGPITLKTFDSVYPSHKYYLSHPVRILPHYLHFS